MAMLTDTFEFMPELVESKEDGRLVARGSFARADVPTANGRVYPGKLWEREIKKLSSKVEGRSLFGLLDHPQSGKTSLKEASHLITNLSFDGNTVRGEMEILPTPNGKILEAIVRAGARVGVSSRGVGSTRTVGEGRQEVQDDYQLMTWDAVADPANATSWPEFRNEDQDAHGSDPEQKMEEDDMDITLEWLQENHPDLVKAIQSQVPTVPPKADDTAMEQRLLSMVQEQNEQALEKARSEALSDPEVGGAKIALESVARLLAPYILSEDQVTAVKAAEAEVERLNVSLEKALEENASLRNTVEELVALTEEATRNFYLQSTIAALDEEEQGRIFSLVGDVTKYADKEEFKGAIKASLEQLGADNEKAKNESEELAALKAENARLVEGRDKAVELATTLGVRAHVERRLANHPQASAIRGIVESTRLNSTAAADVLIEQFEQTHALSDDYNDIAPNFAGGLSHLTEGQEGMVDVLDAESGMGQDSLDQGDGIFSPKLMEDIRREAGIPPTNTGNNGDSPY